MRPQKKTVISSMFLALLAISVLLVILPFFLNPEYLKQLAFDYIRQTFGPHISIGRTAFSLFPHPHIEVDHLVVQESPETHAFFRARTVSLDLRIWPLLRRKELAVSELKIEHPEIEIRRDPEGRWGILGALLARSGPGSLAGLRMMERISMVGGQVIMIDESPMEGVRGVVLDDVHLTVAAQEGPLSSVELRLAGRIRRQGSNASFSLKGTFDPVSPELGLREMRAPESPSRWQFSGQIDLTGVDGNVVMQLGQLDFPSLPLLSQVALHSTIRITSGQRGYDLIVTDFTLESPVATFSGNANIAGLAALDRTISVSFSATPLTVQTLLDAGLARWVPPVLQDLRKKAALGGTVEVVQATVTGSDRSDVGISVLGTFRLHDGFVRRHPTWPDTDRINGTIVVEPDRVKFVDFTGRYDGLPVRSAEGRILFKEAGPWLEVGLTGEVPAERVVAVVSQLPTGNTGLRRLRGWKVSKGKGLLALHFAGAFQGLEAIAFEHGEYAVQNLHVHVPELGQPIVDGQGRFQFSPTETVLTGVSGRVGRHRFTLDGMIDTKAQSRFDGFVVRASLEGQTLPQLWGATKWPDGFRLPGLLGVSFTLSGAVAMPQFKGEVDLTESDLVVPNVFSKRLGTSGVLISEGKIRRDGALVFDRLELLVLPVRIAGKGLLRLEPVVSLHGRFAADPLYLGLLPEDVVIGEGVLRSGIFEVSLDVKGRGKDWRQWQTHGWIALTDGVLQVKGLEAPVTNVFVRMKIGSSDLALQRMEFRIADSDAKLRGTVHDWKKRPSITVAIDSSQFDIDLLIPKGARSPFRVLLETLAARTQVEGMVTIEKPRYQALSMRNLSARLRIHDGLVSVDRILGQADGGSLEGRVFVHLPEDKPAAVRSSFHVTKLPFERVHQSIGHEERLVTGSLTVRGTLQGHGRHAQGVLPTIDGKVDLLIEHGHVRRGTIFPKILAMLNLPNLLRGKVDLDRDGFPFEKLTATLSIEHGIVTTKDAVIRSPIMTMTTVGSYDLARDQLDLVAAVSPFGPYSEFMKQIPLFGKILAGDRKGLATAIFRVRGSVEAPDVTYMPVQSLATGVAGVAQLAVDILKNTVLLPTELFNEGGEHSSAPSSPQKKNEGEAR